MTHSFGGEHEFGESSESAAWGGTHGEEVEGEGHTSTLPRDMDLGGGLKLVLHPDAFRTIMHTPEITSQVAARCQEICDVANGMATVEGAIYVYVVSNNPDNIRARGRVKPGNPQAIADDRLNSTLLKALASVGSDPLPASYGNWEGSGSIGPEEFSGPSINISYPAEALEE